MTAAVERMVRAFVPRITKYIPVVPHVKQQLFLCLSNVLDVFYGGAGGGGKSIALLMAALQYADVPGYSALIIRRTYKELSKAGAIMDRAHEWLARSGAKWDGQNHTYVFPTKDANRPARLQFGYLETDRDRYQYQSAEYQCVTGSTLIRMAGDTLKRMRDIRVGDRVQTLEGPRKVLRTFRLGKKPIAILTVGNGSQTEVSINHRLLSSLGWVSLMELASTEFREAAKEFLRSEQPSLIYGPLFRGLSSRRKLEFLPSPQQSGEIGRRGSGALLINDRSDCKAFEDQRQESSRPLSFFVPLMLHEPAFPSEKFLRDEESNAVLGGSFGNEFLDYAGHCSSGFHHYDARFLPFEEAALGNIPILGGVAEYTQGYSRVGVAEKIRLHTRPRFGWYAHPYTREDRPYLGVVRPHAVLVSIDPRDEREVFDITVQGASHYISYSGIIHQNCICFDELTEFEEEQFRFLFSRLRRAENVVLPETGAPVPLRMRSASNPGGVGHAWVKARYIGKPNTAERAFIPASMDDNPSLDKLSYEVSLSHLNPVDQARIRRGDWAVIEGGSIFDRNKFRLVSELPKCGVIARVRAWDLAATTTGKRTAGVRMSKTLEGLFYIEHVVKGKWTPGDRDKVIVQTAKADGRTAVVLEEEGGSGGLAQNEALIRALAGWPVESVKVAGNKFARAAPFASQVGAGNVLLVEGSWVEEYLDELHAASEKSEYLDQCFVAGTSVLTSCGQTPIEKIRKGDLVYTRKGLRSVTWAGSTGVARVWKIRLRDGRVLIGTRQHRTLTSKGWTPFCRLLNLEVCAWDGRFYLQPKLRHSAGYDTTGERIQEENATSGTSGHVRGIPFTARSGGFTEARFQEVNKFTTKTRTPSTTESKILLASLRTSTPISTFGNLPGKTERSTSTGSGVWRPSGTAQWREDVGTVGMLRLCGSDERKRSISVLSAATAFLQGIHTQSSARVFVEEDFTREPKQRSVFVGGAENRFSAGSMHAIGTVPVRVVDVRDIFCLGIVYNLTVEGGNEYFANGVLVHNCDASSLAFNYIATARPSAAWQPEALPPEGWRRKFAAANSPQTSISGPLVNDPEALAFLEGSPYILPGECDWRAGLERMQGGEGAP